MIALRIDFIAGRFHATPWQRAANDGDVEWPPAPWRLLRALTAGWFRNPFCERGVMVRLCDRLAEAPRFVLPPATLGHARHYMPQGESKGLKPITSLTLDSFVRMDAPERASAWVVWDNVSLDADLESALGAVLLQIPYLGRAESWCRIDIAPDVPDDAAFVHVDLASRAEGKGPVVQRLGAGAALRGSGLWRSLVETTDAMRASRRRQPDGTVWLDYTFPPNFGFAQRLWTEPSLDVPQTSRTERFLLETTRPRGVQPSISDTVRIANLMRNAALKASTSQHSGTAASSVFTGKIDGQVATDHAHAYYLPRDLDDDGRIDHVDVRLPVGAAPGEIMALRSIAWLYDGETRHAATSLGTVDEECARTWRSTTPFVAPRYPKKATVRAGRDAIEAWVVEQVTNELRHHHIEEDVRIELWDARPPIATHRGGNHTRFDTFVQSHKPGGDRKPVYGIDLVFAEPQCGPISIGSESHFGLGQFRAIEDAACAEVSPRLDETS